MVRRSLRPHRALRWGLVVLLAAMLAAAPPHRASQAAPAPINGSGSSYVALAMQQWVADAQTRGLRVNYLPTGSPQGLMSFAQNLVDFAATEAEFSALQSGTDPPRGYQYVPSTAGAVAIMYNVQDKAGRKVDYLQLSRRTVARIFTGDISRWNDPAITADNKGLELPDQPITVVYRGGQSGTTALFYDFVANVAPDVFGPWAARNQFPTDVRIIQLDSSPNFAPRTQAFGGSDQIAQFIASPGGLWSIGYDEFGYSKVYNAPSAYIENGAGKWVLPFARNISAALESARLRPDLSQELSGVYNSTNPEAYPISAYSYIVTQCAPAADRPTCKGPYVNGGVAETLTQWLRYIACEGQIAMADIGYSPLPPNLSQEVANSIARMNGTAPETLTADNCPNPRFRGDTGPASPPPPLDAVDPAGLGGGGSSAATASRSAGAAGGGTGSDAGGGTEAAMGAAGRTGSVLSAGGGSRDWRAVAPVVYDRVAPALPVALPLMTLVALLVLPPVFMGHRRRGASRP
ncbi:substrate-binding domain-containing protein [Rhabdothermincola sp.]|uniref:substrate-binding domain-containing protein n=1 Tax=Rhabdothermincola sp. TaxID=2820405 RepID=UPI002FE16E12